MSGYGIQRVVVVSLSLSFSSPASAEYTAGPDEPAELISAARLRPDAPPVGTGIEPPLEPTGSFPARVIAPLGRRLEPLGRDYRHFFRSSHLALFVAAGGLAFATTGADRSTSDRLHASKTADGFFEVGEIAGSGYVIGGASVALYAVGRLASDDEVGDLGRDLVRAQIVSQTVTYALKAIAGRERPDGTTGSFPSGHTSTSFAVATVLQRRYGLSAGIPAYGAAAYIGVSRIQERRHFLTDVLFGAVLGIAAGHSVEIGERSIALEPFTTQDGAGVSLAVSRSRSR